jgi:sigma-B regulation protein RsbU (phosphoserine phosphatase)
MLDFVLDSLKPRLAILAEAWLTSGATAYGIWEDGRPLAQWPVRSSESLDSLSSVVMPIHVDDAASLELRVVGAGGAAAQGRLMGEATLLAHLIQLEGELESMTTRLVETQDQLLALYDLTHAARSHLSLQDTLNSLAKEASRLLRTASAFAILAMPDDMPIVAQQPVPCLSSQHILGIFYQVQTGQQELLVNIELEDKAEAAAAVASSLFVVPILVHHQVVAALGLLNKTDEPFTSPDMKLARAIAEQGGAQIENTLLLQEALAQARMQTEMELAQQVQLRLLPQGLPQVRGLDLAARSRPALQVGGDFYDYIFSAGRPFTFVIGDISGKGMSAALLMTMTHTAIRGICSVTPPPTPASIVAQANEHLYADLTEVGAFATMFVGQYDHATRMLNSANAGHSPMIYCPQGGPARLLEADGPAIGVLPISLCEDQGLPLRPGDLLIAATDGFSEAENTAGEMFGYERLLRLTESLAKLSASRILNALFAAAEGFSAGHPQDDDQTAVVLKGVPA